MTKTLHGLAITRIAPNGTARSTDPAIIAEVRTKQPELLLITDGLSDFSRFFAPLKPLLSNYRWVLDEGYGDVIVFPNDWYEEYDPVTDAYTNPQLLAAERLILETDDEQQWKYVEGQYLALAADTLRDDWYDFYRLRAPISSLASFQADFWHAAETKTLHDWLTTRIDLFLICVDAGEWSVYSEDEQVLQTVRTHLQTVPDAITVHESTLEEYLFWWYGQPRNET